MVVTGQSPFPWRILQLSKRIVIPGPVLGGVRSLRNCEGLLLNSISALDLSLGSEEDGVSRTTKTNGHHEHHIPSQSLFCRQQDVAIGLRLHSAPRYHCPRRANRNPLLRHLPFRPPSSPR